MNAWTLALVFVCMARTIPDPPKVTINVESATIAEIQTEFKRQAGIEVILDDSAKVVLDPEATYLVQGPENPSPGSPGAVFQAQESDRRLEGLQARSNHGWSLSLEDFLPQVRRQAHAGNAALQEQDAVYFRQLRQQGVERPVRERGSDLRQRRPLTLLE